MFTRLSLAGLALMATLSSQPVFAQSGFLAHGLGRFSCTEVNKLASNKTVAATITAYLQGMLTGYGMGSPATVGKGLTREALQQMWIDKCAAEGAAGKSLVSVGIEIAKEVSQ
ncbi:hypothetical protein MCEMSEM47_00845 [Burkholderiales bacterium]